MQARRTIVEIRTDGCRFDIGRGLSRIFSSVEICGIPTSVAFSGDIVQ
jgi:hypothetical protein